MVNSSCCVAIVFPWGEFSMPGSGLPMLPLALAASEKGDWVGEVSEGAFDEEEKGVLAWGLMLALESWNL